jgi:hypothetical protein
MQAGRVLSWTGTTKTDPAQIYDALVGGKDDRGADRQIVHEFPRSRWKRLVVYAETLMDGDGQVFLT